MPSPATALSATAAARLCGGCPRQGSDRAQCRQGRHRRRPGRGDLPGILTRKIAASASSQQSIMASLQAQNAITPSGVHPGRARADQRPGQRAVRVRGKPARRQSARINDRFFPLTDVATITRGYTDPPTTLFRYNGEPAIGLAIGMKSGANLLEFGEALNEEMTKVIAELPIGVGVHLVSDQPSSSRCRVGIHQGAVRGRRHRSRRQLHQPGHARRARCRPLDPAGSGDHLCGDGVSGITLQRISLGALIIALACWSTTP